MEKRIKKILWILILSFLFGLLLGQESFSENYIMDKDNSIIKCKIRYVLIGKYEPVFEKFESKIFFNMKDLDNSYVEIVIDIDSLKSKYPALDRIACSGRMMDSEKYSEAIFKGDKIKRSKKPGEYYIDGTFDFHGVKQEVSFNFFLKEVEKEGVYLKDKKFVEIQGSWKINRKEFDIIWHDVLDKEGIIVSDHVSIDWKLLAFTGKGENG